MVRTDALILQDVLEQYAISCHAGFASACKFFLRFFVLFFPNVLLARVLRTFNLLEIHNPNISFCIIIYVFLVMCSGLSFESMISGSWTNRKTGNGSGGHRCLLKKAINRDGKSILGKKNFIQSTFLEANIDLLAGMVPLGCHEKWKDEQKQIVDAQYMVSIRHPLNWLVSSMIDRSQQNTDKNITMEDVVDALKTKVDQDLSKGVYHEVYTRYLITPSQISWIHKESADLTIQHRGDLALRNLVDNNALIMITEMMAECLEKLQYVIDVDNETIQKAQSLIQNQNHDSQQVFSTSEIIEEVKKDQILYEQIEEYIKYEVKIYSHAVDIHTKQMHWLRRTPHTKPKDTSKFI